MSRPVTRSKNVNQHPGQILLEGKQKQRTSEQKQADGAQAEQEQQEQEAAQRRGLKQLADIMDQETQEHKGFLTNPSKPRPRPTVIMKAQGPRMQCNTDPSTRPKSSIDETEGSHGMEMEGIEEGEPVNKEGGELVVDTGSQELELELELDDEEAPMVFKRQRAQKTSSRDANQAARGKSETVLFYWDCLDEHYHKCSTESAKGEYAGVGSVRDWADKLDECVPLRTLMSHRLTPSNSRCHSAQSSLTGITGTGTGTGSLLKGPRATPATTIRSSASIRPSTPVSMPPASDTEDFAPYIEGDNNVERQAIGLSARAGSRRCTVSDSIIEVVSGSELDESDPSPPPPSQFHTWLAQKQARKKRKADVHEEISESESADELKISGAPPSKRAKTQHSASASQRSGSGAKNKYINTNLPPGCTNDNIWWQVFVSSLTNFAVDYENPWNIPANEFKTALQLIWDVVYKNSIKHTVVIGGPVFYVMSFITAKQSLSNWRGGFAAAAVTIITAFFAQDPDFKDAKQHAEFATAMLKAN
ncbi:hypothetical protein PAXRUDRAFT_75210, partial [Paxillus rubicundulus Ve08.2h10]